MQDIVLRESKVAQSVSSRRNKGPQDIALVQTSDCEVNETWNAYEPNFAPWEFLSNQTTLASVVPDADEPDSSSWESLSSLSNPSTPTSVVLDLFSCPGSTEVPHQSTSYTRILKRYRLHRFICYL